MPWFLERERKRISTRVYWRQSQYGPEGFMFGWFGVRPQNFWQEPEWSTLCRAISFHHQFCFNLRGVGNHCAQMLTSSPSQGIGYLWPSPHDAQALPTQDIHPSTPSAQSSALVFTWSSGVTADVTCTIARKKLWQPLWAFLSLLLFLCARKTTCLKGKSSSLSSPQEKGQIWPPVPYIDKV